MILGKNWLVERNVSFNKISNTLRICDCGVYYQNSIRHADAEPLILDQSDQSEHCDITRSVNCLSFIFDGLLKKMDNARN